jgi:hypothetical protein
MAYHVERVFVRLTDIVRDAVTPLAQLEVGGGVGSTPVAIFARGMLWVVLTIRLALPEQRIVSRPGRAL